MNGVAERPVTSCSVGQLDKQMAFVYKINYVKCPDMTTQHQTSEILVYKADEIKV